jgi:hypothetical protein
VGGLLIYVPAFAQTADETFVKEQSMNQWRADADHNHLRVAVVIDQNILDPADFLLVIAYDANANKLRRTRTRHPQ